LDEVRDGAVVVVMRIIDVVTIVAAVVVVSVRVVDRVYRRGELELVSVVLHSEFVCF